MVVVHRLEDLNRDDRDWASLLSQRKIKFENGGSGAVFNIGARELRIFSMYESEERRRERLRTMQIHCREAAFRDHISPSISKLST